MDIKSLLPPGVEWWQLPVTVVALVLLVLVAGSVVDRCHAFRSRRH